MGPAVAVTVQLKSILFAPFGHGMEAVPKITLQFGENEEEGLQRALEEAGRIFERYLRKIL